MFSFENSVLNSFVKMSFPFPLLLLFKTMHFVNSLQIYLKLHEI